MTAVDKIRRSDYILEGRVSPKYFFKVVDFIMKNIPQWENTYAWMQTFRYDFSEYLWNLGKLISYEDWSGAVALKRPKTSIQHDRHSGMRMERYLANIISNKKNGILARILIRDEVDALVTYRLEDLLRENRLTMEEISSVEDMISNAGMCLDDFEEQLNMYKYFVGGASQIAAPSRKKGNGDSCWSLAVKAIDRMYANNLSDALGLFKASLSEHDKFSRVKGSFENRILSFFYAVCLVRFPVP